jgi:hypothetical protein
MADATDPMATVRNYIDAFNRGDAKAMAAAFAPQSSILDGMAPHLWVGPTAVRIGIETCWLKGSNTVLQSTVSPTCAAPAAEAPRFQRVSSAPLCEGIASTPSRRLVAPGCLSAMRPRCYCLPMSAST